MKNAGRSEMGGKLKAGVYAVVAAAHVAVFALVATQTPVATPPLPSPPIQISLFRPPPKAPEPPPPPVQPAAVAGGGSPAAPSRVRPSPRPPERPAEVTAPPTPAPTQEIVVGTSPLPGVTPGQGQGGEGTGVSGGSGSGSGPGSGTVRGRPLRQASTQELRALHPPQARGRSGRVSVTCRVDLEGRLDACRIGSETPSGLGFGAAGVAAATRHYRFTPWVRDGREVEGEITVIVEFGRPGR